MPKTIPATITLTDADLARLVPQGANADRLVAIERLLLDLRDNLSTSVEPLLVDESTAGKMLGGISGRSVFDIAARGELTPVYPVPNRKMYVVAELREYVQRKLQANQNQLRRKAG